MTKTVSAIPLTFTVIELPNKLALTVPITREVSLTPLTFEVIVLPDKLNTFVVATVLIKLVSVTPFTFDVNTPFENVIKLVPIIRLVSLTPLMDPVKTFPEIELELLLIIFTFEPVTPFTVVLSEFVLEVFETVLIAKVVSATPLTVDVIMFPLVTILFVVAPPEGI